ncbi:MAG: hypothetical protein BWX88_02079 [Planctomycetes bacterium ADurb.Bin126]|nr:MAG: hypothetical protein BWX88_02079 [Planctomycetes bacterium ADurb.Bin126]HOD81869.1 hypothetical protein [Phycisphaerae bacterium]HQL75766.1 hypothetical protein [Phycisphaerae bacterium]
MPKSLQYLLAGLAAAVGLGWGVWSIVSSLSPPMSPDHLATRNKMHFQCIACGAAMELHVSQLPEGYLAARMRQEPQDGLDCPKCGKKKTCHPDIRCPNCGAHFFSPECFTGDVPEGVKVSQTCPACGTHPVEYYRNRRP